MNKNLKLRKNSDIINQYQKQIIAGILAEIKKTGDKKVYLANCLFEKELEAIGLPKCFSSLKTNEVLVTDHGWLVYIFSVLRTDKNLGRRFNGLLTSKSNNRIGDRSLYVRCLQAVKGQKLIQIEVVTKTDEGVYSNGFIIIDKTGKIIPCEFGALLSPDWDENSPAALAQLETDFEQFYSEIYDEDDFDSEIYEESYDDTE